MNNLNFYIKKHYNKKHCNKKWNDYFRVGGGKNGNPGYKFFRHKKKLQKYMSGKISMSKFKSINIIYWD